ncbi:MAG: HD domain-containing protein [Aggregatilineaceae bacterium]
MSHFEADSRAMLALLDGLLVGAGALLESPGDWAERLIGDHASALAERFVEQLATEWFDAWPPDALCAAVTEQVRAHLSAWHPGWPHLWAHILRVTGLAVTLAEDVDLDPALAYLVGICHDVAKLDELRTSLPHEEAGASFAAGVLQGHFPPETIAAIQAAICKADDGPLARILFDADKLDKIGAAGVIRRVSTGTSRDWLPVALARVEQDAAYFPPMHFARSRALARDKRAFLAWFLPLAEDTLLRHG